MKTLWKTNKKDFFSWTGCLLVCLLAGVEMGLLYGIVLNMIFVLLRLGNPKVEVSLKQVSYPNEKSVRNIFLLSVLFSSHHSVIIPTIFMSSPYRIFTLRAVMFYAPRYVRPVPYITMIFP